MPHIANVSFCGIFAQSENCGVTTAGRYLSAARKQQQMNYVFCAVLADGRTRNSGIRHAIAKQQLRCNRRTVFYTRSMQRCYKQNK
jgi:hypothetical protein